MMDATERATWERAAELLRKGHCIKDFAVDKNGETVPSMSDRAVSWCALGSIMAQGVSASLFEQKMEDAIRTQYPDCARTMAEESDYGALVTYFNDEYATTEQIIELVEGMIK